MYTTKGNGDGQFSGPRGLAVDDMDNIFVCDFNNHRVQVFHPDGKFMSKFGAQGSGDGGQFKSPFFVSVTPQQNIVVSDYDNNRVQVF